MRIIRMKELCSRLSISLPTGWRWLKQDPTFPPAIILSPGITGFTDESADAYIKIKADASRANPSKRAQASIAATASVVKRASNRAAIPSAQGAKKGGA